MKTQYGRKSSHIHISTGNHRSAIVPGPTFSNQLTNRPMEVEMSESTTIPRQHHPLLYILVKFYKKKTRSMTFSRSRNAFAVPSLSWGAFVEKIQWGATQLAPSRQGYCTSSSLYIYWSICVLVFFAFLDSDWQHSSF